MVQRPRPLCVQCTVLAVFNQPVYGFIEVSNTVAYLSAGRERVSKQLSTILMPRCSSLETLLLSTMES